MNILNKSIYGVFLCVLLTVSVAAQTAKRITVAKDGTGDFKTLQQAFNSVDVSNKKKITIFVKNGIYKEKLLLPRGKQFITLLGEDKFNTILTYDDHTGKISPKGDTINTRTSASFLMLADNFDAENITFQNDAGFAAGQAVAIEVDGDKAAFKNCRFTGNQDILFTNNDSSRQYYKNCYIEGTTDFIFGSSTAWFEQCHIHSKKNSHVTAASTPKDHAYGYVFNDCILTGDSTLRSVSLGRPWRSYSSVTYLHCYIDKHIKPEGWSTWNNNENHKTARYAEYKSYGPGGSSANRVSWSRQLSDEEAKSITIKKVLGNWKPDLN
ncbi:MAG: pectin esterase [Segetibacter sp.]|nr:pectin esterase [Segetibacter sp.]